MNYDKLDQRPDDWEMDLDHPLDTGLVFAGLGRLPKSTKYVDSSPYGNHGTLTLMDPATDWVWSQELGRWVLDFAAGTQVVSLPTPVNLGYSYTLSLWINPTSLAANRGLLANSATGDRLYVATTGAFAHILGSYSESSASVVTEGTWQHFGVTRHLSGSPTTWYYNGVAFNTDTSTDTTSFVVDCIGNNGTGLLDFVGQMSDVLLFSGELPYVINILANRSDPMLGGLILPPRRKLWAVSGGGGTAYSETVVDALGMTDSRSLLSTYLRTQADALGLTDSPGKAATFTRTQADNVGLTDAATKTATFVRSITDSQGLTDALVRASEILRDFDDDVGLTDDLLQGSALVYTIADALGVVDAASYAATYSRTQADALGLSDARALLSTFVRTMADAEGLSDAVVEVFSGIVVGAVYYDVSITHQRVTDCTIAHQRVTNCTITNLRATDCTITTTG